MVKRMLIDADHKEETRVCVVDGNQLEEFDFESKVRKQIKGNIYLAKVTRVEPSLQAAFVEYGGNRHGFLAFSEIHPDYYRIPMEDRQALLDEEQSLADREDQEDEEKVKASESKNTDDNNDGKEKQKRRSRRSSRSKKKDTTEEQKAEQDSMKKDSAKDEGDNKKTKEENTDSGSDTDRAADSSQKEADKKDNKDDKKKKTGAKKNSKTSKAAENDADAVITSDEDPSKKDAIDESDKAKDEKVESVGGDDADIEQMPRRRVSNLRKRYKIQEVIKRHQIILVQVTKEERGNKGAAMTTYVSLPGRYCVLMPNSPRGGGVSRKISNPGDRRKMRDIMKSLEIPKGMSVILRTAGLKRTKTEIKRDYEYLMRLWDTIRKVTLESIAPSLVYEEGDLVKRSIRDLYSRDIDEVLVSGDSAYRTVKDLMKDLIPSHAKRIKPYKDDNIPLFHRYQIENQIDEIFDIEVRLKSGGYVVINPTEALVSIDVNSGKSTRERHIDETALKTNLEAADEIARQLRLRDLGGLVVVDFIDMENHRHNAKVERRMKEAMSGDRARVEIGRLSNFGLLELSRQRLRPSLMETHFQKCEACSGVGMVRTVESAAVVVLRAIEEEGIRDRAEEISVDVPIDVALYILNHKRDMLNTLEERYNVVIYIRTDEALQRNDYNVSFSKHRSQSLAATDTSKTVTTVTRHDTEDENTDDRQDSNDDSSDEKHSEEDSSGTGGSSSNKRRGRGRNNRGRSRNNRNASEKEAQDKTPVQENADGQDAKHSDDKESDSQSQDSHKEKSSGRKGTRRVRSPYNRKSRSTHRHDSHKSSQNNQDQGSPSHTESHKDVSSDSDKSNPEPKPSSEASAQDQHPKGSDTKVAAQNVNEDTKTGVQSVNQKPQAPKKGWWQKLVD